MHKNERISARQKIEHTYSTPCKTATRLGTTSAMSFTSVQVYSTVYRPVYFAPSPPEKQIKFFFLVNFTIFRGCYGVIRCHLVTYCKYSLYCSVS